MSWNLIKKAQELLDNDTVFSNSTLKFNKNIAPQEPTKKPSKKRKSNLKGHKKNLSERKIKDVFKLTEASLKDQTIDNVKILKNLDEKLALTSDALKVKELQLRKLEKQRLNPEELVNSRKKIPAKSVFSEEDFERMNNEWLSI